VSLWLVGSAVCSQSRNGCLGFTTMADRFSMTHQIPALTPRGVHNGGAGHPVVRQNLVRPQNQSFADSVSFESSAKILSCLCAFDIFSAGSFLPFARGDLFLENLALRQQLLALHAKRPRPRLAFSTSSSGSLSVEFGLDGEDLSLTKTLVRRVAMADVIPAGEPRRSCSSRTCSSR